MEAGKNDTIKSGAERLAPVSCLHRHIQDRAKRARLVCRARARVKRHFMRGHIENRRIRPENILRPVSVMHIPIDDRHALNAVNSLCVPCRNGGIVEKTKAHRRLLFGMMSGRADCGEGISYTPAHHLINSMGCSACPAQHRFPASGREPRIRIEPRDPGCGAAFLDRLNVSQRVTALEHNLVSFGSLIAQKSLETVAFELIVDHPDPVGPLGMPGWRLMIQKRRVGNEKGGQWHAPGTNAAVRFSSTPH